MSIGARHPVSKHTHERHCTIARRTLTAAVRRWGSSGLKWVTLRGKTNRNGREGEGARAVLFVESGVGLWVFMCETLRPALKYSHYVTVHTYTHTHTQGCMCGGNEWEWRYRRPGIFQERWRSEHYGVVVQWQFINGPPASETSSPLCVLTKHETLTLRNNRGSVLFYCNCMYLGQ